MRYCSAAARQCSAAARQLRCLTVALLLLTPVGESNAADQRVDHSIRILNVGEAEVIDVVYTYGVLGPRPIKRLGLGGAKITKPMPIPEFVEVTWTTEADGQKHSAQIPLKLKVTARQMAGKIVRIEIDGATLKVFLIKRLPHFEEERQQLY